MKLFLLSVLAVIVGWAVTVLLLHPRIKPGNCVTPHGTDVDYIHQRQHFSI